jgi:hypothetical protein
VILDCLVTWRMVVDFNGTFLKWWFSIVMLVYQRVLLLSSLLYCDLFLKWPHEEVFGLHSLQGHFFCTSVFFWYVSMEYIWMSWYRKHMEHGTTINSRPFPFFGYFFGKENMFHLLKISRSPVASFHFPLRMSKKNLCLDSSMNECGLFPACFRKTQRSRWTQSCSIS